jgi:SAM-dependent methyltransferase
LTPTPPANAFVPERSLGTKQERCPLDVFFCDRCAHLQLLDVVDPEILFRDYVYVSGTSPVFVEHFRKYAESVQKDYRIRVPGRVLEIGSNDGTLLRFFKDAGFDILGIDPARNIAEQATQAGIPTLPEFFTLEMARRLRAEKGAMSVILANNVFAHIDDLTEVVRGVRELLDPREGVYVFEVSYLADVIQSNLFDTIYHEHLCYHSLGPLIGFFERNGMQVIDSIRVSSHGGSLRVVAQVAGGRHSVSPRVAAMLTAEKAAGLYDLETFKRFDRSIRAIGQELRSLLVSIKKEGRMIAGFGAPAKATTLMYHFQIGPDLVDFIVDDSPLKQGLYSPGQHIPVVSSKAIEERNPDYLVVLAWNFADSIIAKNQSFLERGGQFVVPFPQIRVVSKEVSA